MTGRLRRIVFGGAFLATMLVPVLALAEDAAEEASSDAWQVSAAKAMAAGLAMGLSAIGTGYAQAKIGAAGAGTLAERPDVVTWILALEALPEIIVLLGFVSAILILG